MVTSPVRCEQRMLGSGSRDTMSASFDLDTGGFEHGILGAVPVKIAQHNYGSEQCCDH
jgi:hypothetical protein